MGTVLASKITSDAQIVFNDVSKVRYTDAECLEWLNIGQKLIATLKPASSVVIEAVQLVAGTKQTIPANRIRLVDVPRNMGADGLTPGAAITVIDRKLLDAQNRTWHTDTANGVVQYIAFDARFPQNFYCYPPQPSTPQYVEEVNSVVPADVDAITDVITLDNIYQPALLDYVLHRGFLKNTAQSSNAQRAANHYQLFLAAIGAKGKADVFSNPRNNAEPENPANTGQATGG